MVSANKENGRDKATAMTAMAIGISSLPVRRGSAIVWQQATLPDSKYYLYGLCRTLTMTHGGSIATPLVTIPNCYGVIEPSVRPRPDSRHT